MCVVRAARPKLAQDLRVLETIHFLMALRGGMRPVDDRPAIGNAAGYRNRGRVRHGGGQSGVLTLDAYAALAALAAVATGLAALAAADAALAALAAVAAGLAALTALAALAAVTAVRAAPPPPSANPYSPCPQPRG